MPKYRVLVRSFIGNGLVEPDTVVEYDGVPSSNLEPLDKDAEKAAKKSDAAGVASIARQKAAAVGGNPDAVADVAVISAAAKAAEEAVAVAKDPATGLV